MRALVLIPLLFSLASPALASPPPEDGCGATRVKSWIGKRATPKAVIAIRKRSKADTMRVIRPDTAVTMDYRESRLNVHVDRRGIIRRLTCG